MRQAKTRIFSGAVCEQIVFHVSERVRDVGTARPKPRFKSEAEREQHRLGISRRNHARMVNANFTPASLYSTLTLNNEYEVHTFDEAKRLRDNFVRRLKYHVPDAKIMLYMGRGRSTSRIHFHMLSDGIPEDLIRKLWGMGEIVRVEPLKEHNYYNGVDHGRDYTGLANYLFDHWTPEQGPRRWKQTRNLKKPEREPAKLVKRSYTENKPPLPPKGYIFVESRANRYGYLYFKYVAQPAPKGRKKKEDPG